MEKENQTKLATPQIEKGENVNALLDALYMSRGVFDKIFNACTDVWGEDNEEYKGVLYIQEELEEAIGKIITGVVVTSAGFTDIGNKIL